MTAAFLNAFTSSASQPELLVKIVVGGQTIRLSRGGVATPDGNFWEAMIVDADPIMAPGDYLSSGPDFASGHIVLADRAFGYQTSGTASNALADLPWQGAAVTLYLWERSLTNIADLATIFIGVVNRYGSRVSRDGRLIDLWLLQASDWDTPIPMATVNPVDFPNAPNKGDDLPLPLVLGDFSPLPMRSPWSATANLYHQQDSGVTNGAVPGVLVDKGTGGNKVKVVYSAIRANILMDRSAGLTQAFSDGDSLSPILPAGVTVTLGTGYPGSPSYIEIDDAQLIAYTAVVPIDVQTTGSFPNTAENAKNAMDPNDETTFATIDDAAGKYLLSLRLPNLSTLGRIESVEGLVAFKGDAANGVQLRMRLANPSGAYSSIIFDATATSTTPQVVRGTVPTDWWSQDWNFGGFADVTGREEINILVGFPSGTNKASIYWACLVVKYRPSRTVVAPVKQHAIYRKVQRASKGFWIWRGRISTKTVLGRYVEDAPAIYEFDAPWYANIQGALDDASGTYTGSAASLMQIPSDIAMFLLHQYGQQTPGTEIETDAAAIGNFVVARSALKSYQGRPGVPFAFNVAYHLGEATTVGQAVAKLAMESLSQVVLNRFDARWHWHVWSRDGRVNFRRDLLPEDVISAEVEIGSDTEVNANMRLGWFHDFSRNGSSFTSVIGPAVSSQGRIYAEVPDQRPTISAGVNAKVDWNNGGSDFNDTIDAAAYASAIALAANLQAKMRIHDSTIYVGFGFHVKTGHNDDLEYTTVPTGTRTVYVAEQSYSPHRLAAALKRALNADGAAFGVTFNVTYNEITNVFEFLCSELMTISVAAGLAQTMGRTGSAMGASYNPIMPLDRYADRYWITRTAGNLTLKFGTGANAAQTAALVLGWDKADTSSAGFHTAFYIRGDRELAAAASQTRYGKRQPFSVQLETVRSEMVAATLRNRAFDLRSEPPVILNLQTMACPDMEIGRTFQFAEPMDAFMALPQYQSGATWLYRAWRTMSVQQQLGPMWHQEITAVET